jgi:hypothetical protein
VRQSAALRRRGWAQRVGIDFDTGPISEWVYGGCVLAELGDEAEVRVQFGTDAEAILQGARST